MNCLEARKYIYDYVQENWEEEKMEDFLKHIATCPDCREELRITHMIYYGIRSLDGEEDMNMEHSYRELEEEAHHFLFRCHFFSATRLVSETLVFWAIAFSGFYFLFAAVGGVFG